MTLDGPLQTSEQNGMAWSLKKVNDGVEGNRMDDEMGEVERVWDDVSRRDNREFCFGISRKLWKKAHTKHRGLGFHTKARPRAISTKGWVFFDFFLRPGCT
ncbi:hypothetical protein ACFX2C_039718 [Malus domestica]